MRLYYFSHRLGAESPNARLDNLKRARYRFGFFRLEFGDGLLWAPWLDMAEAGIDDEKAWIAIDKCIRASDGIILDRDGSELSPGMIRELDIMLSVGGAVEVIE